MQCTNGCRENAVGQTAAWYFHARAHEQESMTAICDTSMHVCTKISTPHTGGPTSSPQTAVRATCGTCELRVPSRLLRAPSCCDVFLSKKKDACRVGAHGPLTGCYTRVGHVAVVVLVQAPAVCEFDVELNWNFELEVAKLRHGSPLVHGFECGKVTCPQAVSRESHRTRNKNKQTNKCKTSDSRSTKQSRLSREPAIILTR
jgi:hypothetical protein